MARPPAGTPGGAPGRRLSTRAYALVFVGGLGVLLLLSVAGGVLQRSGVVRDASALETPIKVFVFGVFLAMGFSGMPLMLRLFLAGQRRLGNAGHPLVRLLADHETLVIVGFWSACLLGLLIALPVMLRDEFFGPGGRVWLENTRAGRPRGVLVASVGMTVDEVRRRSTLPVGEARPESLTGSAHLIAEVVFDFEIAGTGTRFERCRYYFVETRPRGDPHVRSINVGVSPRGHTRAEHDEEMRRVRERLRADGWAPGRFVYRKPEEIAAGEGLYWLKGEALLHLEPKRVDDEQRGEDPATAGRFMLAVHLSERSASGSYPNLEFSPPGP